MQTKPELIIFDCDGVLVDSEPIAIRMLVESIQLAGGTIDTETAYERFLGRSQSAAVSILAQDFGIAFTPNQQNTARARLFEAFRRELKSIAGIEAALAQINLKRCVASSSLPDRIGLSLGVTGLLQAFEPHIFSASMVAKGKPEPDLFLYAAKQMGVAPKACLVIEDSPAGIEAAHRAGMRAYAFTGGGHAKRPQHLAALEASAPNLVFDDMQELPSLLT